MDDETRIELETRLLFQEDTLAKLSDVLADQQRQIDRLRDALDRVVDLLAQRADDAEIEAEPLTERLEALRRERPPHY